MTFQNSLFQTQSSSETPPTIYRLSSLKYDLASQTAMCIQWNSIFLITGFIHQSVCKGLTQASSHLLWMVGEPLLFLHVKALLDSNDGILEDRFILVLSFIEILSWAKTFYYGFIFYLYNWHFVGEESETWGELSMDTGLATCRARTQMQFFWFWKCVPSIMLDFLLGTCFGAEVEEAERGNQERNSRHAKGEEWLQFII